MNKIVNEQSESQMNANETNGNSNNYSTTAIENTPFRINGDDQNGYFISMGDYKLSEQVSKETCIEMIENRDWSLIMTIITSALHMMHNNEQMKEFLNNNKNQQS